MLRNVNLIKKEYLKSIYTDNHNIPDVYFHPNALVRWLYWERLNQMVKMLNTRTLRRSLCLDFGGGSGVFLPTLGQLFERVVMVDLDPSQAYLVKETFKLHNCEIVAKDVFEFEIDEVDVVIAADVIEHFRDTKKIINRIKSYLGPEGRLITSLPTENIFYRFMRILFNEVKPTDHYFSAYEIERNILDLGFKREAHRGLPLPASFKLFSVTMWKLL